MRKSARTIRHLQRCREAQRAKKQRRKNKVAQDTARMQLRKRIENNTLCLKAAIVAVGLIAKGIHSLPNGGNVVKLPARKQTQASPTRKAA